MFVCHPHKFVYVAYTKSGSSTVYKVLGEHFQGRRFPRASRKIRPEDQTYTSFTVVRNPYSRLISWWWSICNTGGDRYGHKRELKQLGLSTSLSDFLTLWEQKRGTDQHTAFEMNGGFDHVLKLENLQEEFNTLPFITEYMTLPCINSKKHPDWKELLDPVSGSMINRIYQKDFELFGYEMMEF